MKKPLIVSILVLLALVVSVLIWNSSQAELVVASPVPNQNLGVTVTVSGKISSILLKEIDSGQGINNDFTFGVEISDTHGTSMGQVVQIPIPWWSRFVSIPIQFDQQIDTSGMDAATPTFHGTATLVVRSYTNKKFSSSVPVNFP